MENIVSYFRRITKLEPTKEQIEALEALADISIKNLCLCCGRGFSKSLLCAVAALWFADVYADSIGRPIKILIISSQKELYGHLNNFFRDNEDIDKRLIQHGIFDKVPVEGFELNNRSIVDTCSPTSQAIRSRRVDIVFIDEACLVQNEVFYKAALPVLTGNICRVVLLSTPSEDNFFVDISSDPNKYDYKLIQYSSEVCPWQEESNKRLKKTLSKQAYATEVLARLPKPSERSFFNPKTVLRCFQDISSEPEKTYGSMILAGIDLGFGLPNNTVISITEKKKSKVKLIVQVVMKGLDLEKLSQLLRTYNPMKIKVDSKPPELLRLIREGLPEYKNRLRIIDATTRKKQILTQLQTLINSGNLAIPKENVSLKLEFERYHLHKRSGDNRIDSLALAIFESFETEIQSPRCVYFPKDFADPKKSRIKTNMYGFPIEENKKE